MPVRVAAEAAAFELGGRDLEMPVVEAKSDKALLDTEVSFSFRSKLRFAPVSKRVRVARIAAIVLVSSYLIGVVFINIWVSVPNRRVVTLYGDSLIRHCIDYYHMKDFLFSELKRDKPAFNIEVNGWGHALFRIGDLADKMHNIVLHPFDYSSLFTWQLADPPDAVILYWDSDVNPGPRDGSDPMNNATVAAYLDTLYDVLDTLTDRVGTVIMSGPTLSGELPRGQNPLDEALDYYAQLNNDTAALYNITYVNTRDAFFANLPEGWNETSGYLTVDGEHPNKRGAHLLRKAFRQALSAASDLW